MGIEPQVGMSLDRRTRHGLHNEWTNTVIPFRSPVVWKSSATWGR